MNEITKIHLGRQAFTISVDAHKELRAYLEAIKHQVGKQGGDVADEVELRMAELLMERGVTGDKVVLLSDVTFLKEQLGKPGDFKEDNKDEDADQSAQTESGGTRRLYRDTKHGMLAGVSSGLGAYFGIDPIIIRIIFVVLTLAYGWGIVLYLLLWLLTPEAKTPSERLQMQGKPVTVDTLKEMVDKADFKSAAERASTTASKALPTVLKGVNALVGVVLTTIGSAILFGGLSLGAFLLINGAQVNNQVVFPITTQEWVLASCILMTVAIVGLFFLVGGMALIRGKGGLPLWAGIALTTLLFASISIGAATTQAIWPQLEQRIDRVQQQFLDEPCQESIFNYCYKNNHPELFDTFPIKAQ